MYVESLLGGARHIEIQIFADSHGNVIHLNERDCSLQRRHQKVIEEAPSPAVDPELREKMGIAAIQAARAVNYEGAGTVEFLLSPQKEFYFLEMNTRLQVEHPVTELVTGLDLVHMQLMAAAGIELQLSQDEVSLSGHAMEARIYAEDPSTGFLPSIGPIARFDTPVGPGVRVDSGVRKGDEVTTSFDPMLAKIIVHAPDRDSAIQRLDQALSETILHGVKSNIEFCREILNTETFRGPGVTTDYLEGRPPNQIQNEISTGLIEIIATAAERFGLNKSKGALLDNQDNHSGHEYDPFTTLTKRFP